MDAVIAAAGRALAHGDILGALNSVSLRADPAALALRGIAMAQLGDLDRARALLRQAERGFGAGEATARARCLVAQAEIALVQRDLNWPEARLASARALLAARGDRLNATHALHLQARRLLLLGRVDGADAMLAAEPAAELSPALTSARQLILAGIAMRRVRAGDARRALAAAERAAKLAGLAGLRAEVKSAKAVLDAPVARLIAGAGERLLSLDAVEALQSSDTLIVDACRNSVRLKGESLSLATRPVLFALLRVLSEHYPADVPRDVLLARGFGARFTDDSHRVRLRVEIGRLRGLLAPWATLTATRRGFALHIGAAKEIAVLAPPSDERHAAVLALLSDGEAWSSSALALALGKSARTTQRALDALATAGKVQYFGHGRARRWITPPLPGFPALLLLPGPLPGG